MQNDYQTLLDLISRNVRKNREIRKISQEELAWQCNIDRTYVSKIERGIANPSILVLHKISSVLGINIFNLIDENYRLKDQE